MVDELANHCLDVGSVDDQDPIETLPTDGAYEPLGKRVGSRS